MGSWVELEADDGHRCRAWSADPDGPPRGGVVVLQEIFGINIHIRDVCDRFARQGWSAVAPALYDRSSQRDVELGYTGEDVALGRRLREEFSWDDTVRDVAAAAVRLRVAALRVGSVGYCWGGTMSFLAAARLELDAAVVYYGGQILPYLAERPRCPLLMHFGRQDASIPLDDVERIRGAHPEAIVHLYDAGHGFNCDRRGAFDADAAALAAERTEAFFTEHLAQRS